MDVKSLEKIKNDDLTKILTKKTYLKLRINKKEIDGLKKDKEKLIKILQEKKEILQLAKERQLMKIKILKNLDEIKKELFVLYNLLLFDDNNEPVTIILKESRKKFIEEINKEVKTKKPIEELKKEVKEKNIEEVTKNLETKDSKVIKKEEDILKMLEKELESIEQELKDFSINQ
jgi:hypothetical protein